MSNDAVFSPLYAGKKNTAFNGWEIAGNNAEATGQAEDAPNESSDAEYTRLREEAREQGFSQGMKEAEQSAQALRLQCQAVLEQLGKPQTLLSQALDKEVIQTIILLCKHCIGIELRCDPEALTAVWRSIALQLPSISDVPVLQLHPEDLLWFQSNLADTKTKAVLDQAEADETLQRGDFHLSFKHGDIDGRLMQRLKTIVSAELEGLEWDDKSEGSIE